MFPAPWRSRAIAVATQESIPPLKSTTACLPVTSIVPQPENSRLKPLSLPDPTQICEAATRVVQAIRPRESIPPKHGAPTLPIFLRDRQTPAKKAPRVRVAQADVRA